MKFLAPFVLIIVLFVVFFKFLSNIPIDKAKNIAMNKTELTEKSESIEYAKIFFPGTHDFSFDRFSTGSKYIITVNDDAIVDYKTGFIQRTNCSDIKTSSGDEYLLKIFRQNPKGIKNAPFVGKVYELPYNDTMLTEIIGLDFYFSSDSKKVIATSTDKYSDRSKTQKQRIIIKEILSDKVVFVDSVHGLSHFNFVGNERSYLNSPIHFADYILINWYDTISLISVKENRYVFKNKLLPHNFSIDYAILLSDGKHITIENEDDLLLIDLNTGAVVNEFDLFKRKMQISDYSSERGEFLLSDGVKIYLLNPFLMQPRSILNQQSEIDWPIFTPDGNGVCIIGSINSCLYNLTTNQISSRSDLSMLNPFSSNGMSPAGKYVYVNHNNSDSMYPDNNYSAGLFDVYTGNKILLPSEITYLNRDFFSYNDKFLFYTISDAIFVLDLETFQQFVFPRPHYNQRDIVYLAPQSDSVFIKNYSGLSKYIVWNVRENSVENSKIYNSMHHIYQNMNNEILLFADDNDSLFLFRSTTNKVVSLNKTRADFSVKFDFSNKGNYLAHHNIWEIDIVSCENGEITDSVNLAKGNEVVQLAFSNSESMYAFFYRQKKQQDGMISIRHTNSLKKTNSFPIDINVPFTPKQLFFANNDSLIIAIGDHDIICCNSHFSNSVKYHFSHEDYDIKGQKLRNGDVLSVVAQYGDDDQKFVLANFSASTGKLLSAVNLPKLKSVKSFVFYNDDKSLLCYDDIAHSVYLFDVSTGLIQKNIGLERTDEYVGIVSNFSYVLTTSEYGNSIYSIEDEKKLFTRFDISETEWIAYDEYSRYDGTPNAIKNLKFECKNKFVHDDVKVKSLYVPGLVEKYMAGEKIEVKPLLKSEICEDN